MENAIKLLTDKISSIFPQYKDKISVTIIEEINEYYININNENYDADLISFINELNYEIIIPNGWVNINILPFIPDEIYEEDLNLNKSVKYSDNLQVSDISFSEKIIINNISDLFIKDNNIPKITLNDVIFLCSPIYKIQMNSINDYIPNFKNILNEQLNANNYIVENNTTYNLVENDSMLNAA